MNFFKRGDIIIIIVILAISGFSWMVYNYFLAEKSPKAEIYYYSQLVETIDLSEKEAYTFSIEEDKDVVFQLDGEGSISFIKSDCPDKVCIKSGKLHKVGEFAACLPNNIMLKIVPSDVRDSDDADIVIGY